MPTGWSTNMTFAASFQAYGLEETFPSLLRRYGPCSSKMASCGGDSGGTGQGGRGGRDQGMRGAWRR